MNDLNARLNAIKSKLVEWENDPKISKADLTEMIYNLINFHLDEFTIKLWMNNRGINDPTDSQNRNAIGAVEQLNIH